MRNNFQIYIVRSLKNTCSNTRITKSSLEAIDSMIRLLTEKITDTSVLLTINDEKKTISKQELEVVCNLFLSEFIHDINTLSLKSLEQWELSEKVQGELQTRENRCGLIFSVSLCEKYLRQFGRNTLHITSEAPVYLASALQVVTRSLLQSIDKVTREDKKVTINIRHIFLAVSNEFKIFSKLGFVFLEGGVEPDEQVSRKVSRQVSNEEDSSQVKTRTVSNRHVSRTISQIKRLQRTGDVLMQHAPFNNLIRELLPDYRLTADFCITFQCFIEDCIIQLMKKANMISLHTGRETVYDRDVLLALSLNKEKYDKQVINTHIPEAALRHMALRAGIKRFGECSKDVYRNYMVCIMKDFLKHIKLCTDYHGLKTVNRKVLLEVLDMRNIHLSIISKSRKVCRTVSSSN
jgi:histone H2A